MLPIPCKSRHTSDRALPQTIPSHCTIEVASRHPGKRSTDRGAQATPIANLRGATAGALPEPVYARVVSAKLPQTYILHTVALFVVIVAAMVAFLVHQWG